MCSFSCFISSLRNFYRLFWSCSYTPISTRSTPNPVSLKKKAQICADLLLLDAWPSSRMWCDVCPSVCLPICLSDSICFVWHQSMNCSSFSSYSKQVIRKGEQRAALPERKPHNAPHKKEHLYSGFTIRTRLENSD